MTVKSSGLSLSRLAELAGISKARISQFQRGLMGLTLDSAEALCDVLGLELVQTRPPPEPQGLRVRRLTLGIALHRDGSGHPASRFIRPG
jgi:transcriptional regulator with XRE-family HTH domain